MESEKQFSYSNGPIYGTIKGSIQIQRNEYGDDDVLALHGLKVTLLDADNQWVNEDYTDDNGEFAFLGTNLKSYTIVFPEAIDYRNQRFLPESSEVQYQFPVDLTPEKPRVNNLHMRYGLRQTGMIEGYMMNTEAQSISA